MKLTHKLLLAAFAAFFIAGQASAQNAGTVTSHAFAIGKGAGTAGYTSLLCGSAQLAVGQSAADPICKTITGDVTISAAGVTAIGTTKVTSAMLNADVFSTTHSWSGQQTFTAPVLGTPASGTLTNATGLPISTGVSGLATGIASFLATPSSANLRAALTDEVGTGAAYFVGGALGTPASGTATNLTGLPVSTGISGLGTGVATFLATPSSANIAAAVTDETGSGKLVFGTSPNITTPTGIVKGDVGLGNVDNTSDATKWAASATLTNKTFNCASNTCTVRLGSDVTGTLPFANGGLGITSGTSGGIPYFSSSSAIASSAALTANAPVIGGGAGAAPTVGSRSGNTTTFGTTSGSFTSGNCLKSDASGNIVDNGSTCGGGGGGSPGGSTGQVQYNNAGAFGGLAIGSGIINASGTLKSVQPKVTTFTFDASLSSNFSVTGVGFQPRSAIFMATVPTVQNAVSWGMTDGTTTADMNGRGSTVTVPNYSLQASVLGIVTNGISNQVNVSLVSLDSDGATFSRALTGSPSGTVSVMAMWFP